MIYNYNNTPPNVEYSIASKVFCTQTAYEVASEAIQIFDGNGLAREYPVEKFFRDARAESDTGTGVLDDDAFATMVEHVDHGADTQSE